MVTNAGYVATLDVTGGPANCLPEEILLRIACIVYSCTIPSAGIKDAFGHLKDTFDWYNRTAASDKLLEFSMVVHSKALDAVTAPRFVIDEE